MDYEKISPTALLVASLRGQIGIPYAKEIAELTNAKIVVPEFVKGDTAAEDLMRYGFMVRSKAVQAFIEQTHPEKILELAFGHSPYSLIYTKNPHATYVGVDLPAMVEKQRWVIEQLAPKRENIHLLAGSATDSVRVAAIADEFFGTEPITVIAEGLWLYLNPETDVPNFVTTIEALLKPRPGSAAIITNVHAGAQTKRHMATSTTTKTLEAKVGRPVGSWVLPDTKAVCAMFEGRGLTARMVDPPDCEPTTPMGPEKKQFVVQASKNLVVRS